MYHIVYTAATYVYFEYMKHFLQQTVWKSLLYNSLT